MKYALIGGLAVMLTFTGAQAAEPEQDPAEIDASAQDWLYERFQSDMRADASRADLRAVRVDAVDVEALALFYADAFGLQETRRLEGPTFLEIIMSFSPGPELTAQSSSASFVILSRPEGAPASPVANVIFDVRDIEVAMERVVELGGSIAAEPALSGTLTYAFVLDPEGNRIELISE